MWTPTEYGVNALTAGAMVVGLLCAIYMHIERSYAKSLSAQGELSKAVHEKLIGFRVFMRGWTSDELAKLRDELAKLSDELAETKTELAVAVDGVRELHRSERTEWLTLTLPGNWVYEGYCKNGISHGAGRECEVGFINQYYSGTGVACPPYKLLRFAGNYKDGMRHGRGIEYDAKGKFVSQGMWENDKKC